MYFLQQLTYQFQSLFFLSFETPEAIAMQDNIAGIDDIDEAQKYLEALKASEKIVGTHVQILGNFLEAVALGKIEGLSSDDPEFLALKEKFDTKISEYDSLAQEGDSFNSHIESYISKDNSELINELSEALDKLDNESVDGGLNEKESEVDKIARENIEFEESERKKGEFLGELQEKGEQIDKKGAEELVEKYGLNQINAWNEEIESNTDDAKNIIRLFIAIDSRNFENLEKLKDIEVEEFLTIVPHSERLKYFSHNVDEFVSKTGNTMQFTFKFSGETNENLESGITAAMIIPESISSVKVGGVEYVRKGLQGEFISEESGRLVLREGDSIETGTVKSTDEIKNEHDTIGEQLEGLEGIEKDTEKNRLLLGLGELDSSTKKVLKDVVGNSGSNQSGALQSAISQIATTPGIDGNGLPRLEGKGFIGVIWNFIADMLDDPKSAVSQAGGIDAYADSIGLSPEELKEFGETGAQLAAWLQSIKYKKFVDKKWNCGANVGEALNAFGIKGLPNNGRDGHKWAQFMENKPSQFKELKGITPENAPAGAVISYAQNSGGSVPRQKYGHVEIALGNNSGYYFGQKNVRPGGSNPNPAPGTYRIFIPISKTA